MWSDLRNRGNLQGGSTITQQYVKTQYTGRERTASRKIREAILSMKLEEKYSKDEIFERYLNAIYFGRGAYGVQAASRAYFAKDVAKAGLPEASYLAGLIRAPELADAHNAPDVANARRNATLSNMVRFGSVTPSEAAGVEAQPVKSYVGLRTAAEPSTVMADKGTQFFVDYAKAVLIRKYPEEMVEGGGMKIKTTLDLNLQRQAHDAIYGFLKPGEPAGALVSVDGNGQIKTMVGGRSYSESKVNLAVSRLAGAPYGGGNGRQAGSTFKPFALATALENGASLSKFYDAPAKKTFTEGTGQPWTVNNYGNQGFGRMSLLNATVQSVNTVYAQLSIDETPQKIADMAKRSGITTPLKANQTLVLGTEDVSVLDMASAYMTFATRGEAVPPSPILEVRNAAGELLERNKPKRTKAMSQQVADTVNFALQQVVQRGTGKAAAIGQPLAGKTGTTEENGDAWFVGYTPELSTAVWMGFPEGSQRQMKKIRGVDVTGGTFPAQMFATFMQGVTKGKQSPAFASPQDLPNSTEAPIPEVEDPGASSTTGTLPPGTGTTTSSTSQRNVTSTTAVITTNPAR